MSTDTGEKLRKEIWARPHDRALLMVYADWLAEQGQASRAEYMQLSLLERRTAEQERRRAALLKRDRGKWLGAARKLVWTWQESEETPGFVALVRCSMPKLVQGFDAVCALGPRLVISISEPKAKREVLALATLPLGQAYGLELLENDAQWITDELLTTIAPRLSGLRKLVLHPGEARSSDRGWRALVQHLDALEDLELSLGENPEQWMEALLASPLVGSLRRLSLPGWIDASIRGRLAKALSACDLELRDERRMRFNRETGYYIP